MDGYRYSTEYRLLAHPIDDDDDNDDDDINNVYYHLKTYLIKKMCNLKLTLCSYIYTQLYCPSICFSICRDGNYVPIQ